MIETNTLALMRLITFTVTTLSPLPSGQQIFITGNHENLGNWAPDGLPLTRLDDDVWRASASLPTDSIIEYKITRGSWETEEAWANGVTPGNYAIAPEAASETQHEVTTWLDMAPDLPRRITGDYAVHENMESKFLDESRDVIAWLPPSYKKDEYRRYPVLYMHDGQQVFDPNTSTHQRDWEVDEWCTKLIQQQKITEIIVVAAYCTAARREEYHPAMRGEAYARFLIDELKPMIDATYRTLPEREHTTVAGASMGGLISFHLAWNHSDVFSSAACLSPAFCLWTENGELFDTIREQEELPPVRIYLYCGAADELEQQLLPPTRDMHDLLIERGFTGNEDLLYHEDLEAEHNEAAWAAVTGEWLTFLFGEQSTTDLENTTHEE